jgi:copper chaperone CopZ
MITRARVEGMMCRHCITAVFTALAAVEGVERAEVGLGWIEVVHDGRVTVEELKEAVRVAGYGLVEVRSRRGLRVVEAENG